MKKKGFTLIELLAVVILLGIMLMFAVPSITSYIKRGTVEYYNALEKELKTTGMDYLETYRSLLPRQIDHVTVIDLKELVDNHYIEEIKDENGNICSGNITVKKVKTGEYDYYSCLVCGETYETKGEGCTFSESDNQYKDQDKYKVEVASNYYKVNQTESFQLPKAKVYYEGSLIESNLVGSPEVIDTNKIGSTRVIYYYHGARQEITVEVVDTTKPTKPEIVLRHNNANGSSYLGKWYSGDIYQQYKSTDYTKPGIMGSGIKEYRLSSNGTTFSKISGDSKITTTNGQYTYYVKAIDNSGNESIVNSYTIKIDKESPKCSLEVTKGTKGDNDWYTSNIEIGFKSKTDGYSKIDPAIITPNKIEENIKNKTVSGLVTDEAGNTGTCSIEVNVDNKRPTKPVITGGSNSWINGTRTISVSEEAEAFSGVRNYQYYISTSSTGQTGGRWIDLSSGTKAVIITDNGTHYIYFRAVNNAGVIGEVSAFQTTKIDTNTIDVPGISGESTTWVSTSRTFTMTAPSSISGIKQYEYYVSNSSTKPANNVTVTGTSTSTSINIATTGTYVYFRVVNNTGTKSEWSNVQNLYVDRSTPAAPGVSGESTTLAGSRTYTLTAPSSTSGIVSYEYYVSNSTTQPANNVTVSGSSTQNSIEINKTGTYIYFRAVNKAGTKGVWTTSKNLYVDTALLSSLSVTGYTISPTFKNTTLSYSLTVPNSVTSVTINYTKANSSATVQVSGNTNLVVWSNTVKVTVTGPDGNTKIYQIAVKRMAAEEITITAKNTTYTGSAIGANKATIKSGLTPTYTYYNGTTCSGSAISTPVNVGNYSVKVTTSGNSDYEPGSKCVTHTITKGTPILSLADKTATYTGSAVTSNAASATLPNGTVVTLTYKYTYYSDSSCTSVITTPINAGTYYVKATNDATSNLVSTNSRCAKITINKKSVAVTWGSTTTFTYTGSAQAPTASVATGISGETMTVNRTTGTNIGSYTSTATCGGVSGGQKTCNNYTLTENTKAFTIGKKAVTVTASSNSKTYNGASLTQTSGCTGSVISGHTLTCTNTGTITNAGTATNTLSTVVIKNSSGTDVTANYTVTKANGTLTVNKKSVAVTWGSTTSFTYNGSGQGPTASVATGVSGETMTVNRSTGTNVGSYTSTATCGGVSGGQASCNNYTLTGNTKAFTIGKKAVTVTASGASKTYDGTALTKTSGCALFSGLVSGHTPTCTNTGTITNAGTATNTLSTVVIKNASGTDVTANYTVTKANGTLTVNKKSVAVTWGSTTSFTYNGSGQAPTASVTTGVSGETMTVNRTTGTNAGSYTSTATCGGVSGGQKSCNNYTLTGNTKGFTIGKKVVTVTASGTSKTYDGTALTQTSGCTGSIISGHTLTCTNTGTITNAGTATNTLSTVVIKNASGTDVTANYTVTKANGTLTVNKKSVAVTWGSTTTFTYNGSSQGPTASVTTGVSGETMTVNRTTATNVGSHTSTASCASVSGGQKSCNNYTLTGNTKEFSIKNNTVATLKSLEVVGYSISPTFSSNITSYTVTTEATSVVIKATATNSYATVTGAGTKTLEWGSNSVNVIVTAQDGTIKTYTITIDNKKPTAPVIQKNPDVAYSNKDITVSVKTAGTAVSGVKHYEYWAGLGNPSNYGAIYASGTTSNSFVMTGAENKATYGNIYYRAVSNNGNYSDWTNTSFTISKEVPSISSVTGTSTSWTTSKTIKVTTNKSSIISGMSSVCYYVSDSSTLLSSATAVDCKTNLTSNDVTFNVATSGKYIFFKLVSGSGMETLSSSYNLYIDTGKPTAPIITGGSDTWTSSSRTISVSTGSTSLSGIAKYQYYISSSSSSQMGGSWKDCSTSTTSQKITENGEKYIFFRAVNNTGTVGNVSSYQITKIDSGVPGVASIVAWKSSTGTSIASGVWSNEWISYTLNGSSATSGISYYQYCTDTANTCIPDKTLTGNSHVESSQYIRYRAVSVSGVLGIINSYNALIDITIPTVSYSVAGGSYATTKTVTVTGSDTNFNYMNVHVYKNDVYQESKSITTGTNSTFNVSLDSDAKWRIYAQVYDKAGNKHNKTPDNGGGWYYQDYLIDTTIPTVSYSLAGGNYTTTKTLTVTGSDSNFSHMHVHVYKDDVKQEAKSVTSGTSSTFNVSLDSAGTWKVYAQVYDKVGNKHNKEPDNGGGWYYQTYTIATCSYAIGDVVKEFSYTGNIQKFTVPCNGTYKLEVWGAQGGSTSFTGGYGGYSSGNISLSKDATLYIGVGGAGGGTGSGEAGYNGGGLGSTSTDLQWSAGGGGGGATHIGTFNNTLASHGSTSGLYIVAGGGGGAGAGRTSGLTKCSGGTGGGTTGGTTGCYCNESSCGPSGATQSAGGSGYYGGSNGSFGQGGSCTNTTYCGSRNYGAGGGGGLYGGGGGGNWNGTVAGSGGSGYTGGVANGSMTNGNRSGNGYAKITYVSSDTNVVPTPTPIPSSTPKPSSTPTPTSTPSNPSTPSTPTPTATPKPSSYAATCKTYKCTLYVKCYKYTCTCYPSNTFKSSFDQYDYTKYESACAVDCSGSASYSYGRYSGCNASETVTGSECTNANSKVCIEYYCPNGGTSDGNGMCVF